MIDWFRLPAERKIDFITTANSRTGIQPQAIEKDWWVTLTLQVIFSIPRIQNHIIFKGGTSLSKGWDLIQRFSEDVDLAIDRRLLEFPDVMSKTQVHKLRKAASAFVSTELKDMIYEELVRFGMPTTEFAIEEEKTQVTDQDPKKLFLYYKSVLAKSKYVTDQVLLEIGGRSMMEPIDSREIHSILGMTLASEKVVDFNITIPTVIPERTFLEKIFLLHEEFSKPTEHIRVERLSRHLYDLERIMDTKHGQAALNRKDLFIEILKHRQMFTPVKEVEYTSLTPEKIRIVPPAEVILEWEKDYKSMQEEMIFGDSIDFESLISRIKELNDRVNAITLK